MPTVKFWGASDDLVEIEGCTSARDFTTTSEQDENVVGLQNSAEFNIPGKATFIVNGQVIVKAEYTNIGVWAFTAYTSLEDTPYPDWTTTIHQSKQCDYSMELSIEIPDELVQVHRIK